MAHENDSTARGLKAKIERLKKAIARDDAVVNRETQYVSPFIAGGSNYSPSMSRKLDAEIDRRVDAAVRYQANKRELASTEHLLTGYLAGELHANGQRRKDAPSRQGHKEFADTRAAFIKTFAKVGGQFAIWGSESQRVTVKKVNPKSIKTVMDATWKYGELIPLNESGVAMTGKEFGDAFRAWKSAREEVQS